MGPQPSLKVLARDELTPKVCVVVGTRPGIIMMSPVVRELARQRVDFFLIHTGQHYSYNMDRVFLEELVFPEPSYKLETVKDCRFHGEQTAEMLKGVERALLQEKPAVVLVGGDANTNLAGALAARKLHIQIGHIEAGERSGDWRMPEEHNRVIIDHISEYLFATGEKAKENLIRESVRGKIFVTGNTIVDAAYQNRDLARQRRTLESFHLRPGNYVLMTLHREENVDDRDNLRRALEGAAQVCHRLGMAVIFLAHPRTQKRIQEFGLEREAKAEGLRLEEPVGYLDFLNLLSQAALVLTDSGGVQQEACILQVPSVTLRDNTEWVETLALGANTLAGTDPERIVRSAQQMLQVGKEWQNPFGDGKSAARIVDILRKEAL